LTSPHLSSLFYGLSQFQNLRTSKCMNHVANLLSCYESSMLSSFITWWVWISYPFFFLRLLYITCFSFYEFSTLWRPLTSFYKLIFRLMLLFACFHWLDLQVSGILRYLGSLLLIVALLAAILRLPNLQIVAVKCCLCNRLPLQLQRHL